MFTLYKCEWRCDLVSHGDENVDIGFLVCNVIGPTGIYQHFKGISSIIKAEVTWEMFPNVGIYLSVHIVTNQKPNINRQLM